MGTRFFNLKQLGPGSEFSEEGYKYTYRDRAFMDLLFHIALNHDHDADSQPIDPPDAPVGLELDDTTGALPGASRIYYKYTYLDEYGIETEASPEAFIDTATPIATPGSPALQRGTVGGQLRPGSYFYLVTAWKDADTLETVPSPQATTTLPANGGSAQRIEVLLPDLPDGADGFNLYRRIPGAIEFHHLATIDAADAEDTYHDLGAVEADCERLAPRLNTTGESNSVTITLPVDDPYSDPAPGPWRLYRTLDPGDWSDSFLATVEAAPPWEHETSELVTPLYLDMGDPTTTGEPPLETVDVPRPPPLAGRQVVRATLSDRGATVATGTRVEAVRVEGGPWYITDIRGSLLTASDGGAVSVDVLVNGVSVTSTLLTIDDGSLTSVGSAAPVEWDQETVLNDDDEVSFDILSAGANAVGLKAALFLQKVS